MIHHDCGHANNRNMFNTNKYTVSTKQILHQASNAIQIHGIYDKGPRIKNHIETVLVQIVESSSLNFSALLTDNA